jgi:thioesterase domain-containing protein
MDPGHRTSYRPPQTEAERVLADIWASLLPVKRVSLTDNFFDLGATSVLLVSAILEARRAGLDLNPAQFVRAENLRDLAAMARPAAVAGESPPGSRLMPLSGDGQAPPRALFLPSMGGTQFTYAAMARKMAVHGSIWAWRLPGLDGGTAPLDSVPDMARAFREEATRWAPPVLRQVILGGLSFGGLLAFQVMADLQQADISVRATVLISPPPLLRKSPQYRQELVDLLWQRYGQIVGLPEADFRALSLSERSLLAARAIAANLEMLSDEWIARRFLPPREALTDPGAISRRLAVEFSNLYAAAVHAPDLPRTCSRTVAIVPYGDIPHWNAIQSSWDGFEWDAVYFVPGSHTSILYESPDAVAEIMCAEMEPPE